MPRETINHGGKVYNVAKTKEEALMDYQEQGRIYIANGSMTPSEVDEVVDTVWPKKYLPSSVKNPLTIDQCFKL